MIGQIKNLFHPTQQNNQKFRKQFYVLKSDVGKRVLDIEQQGAHQGRATIYKSWKGPNQQFAMKQLNATDFLIRCKAGGYLTVSDASDNAKIVLQPLGPNDQPKPNQIFKIGDKTKTKRGRPIFTYCGKVLDVFQEKDKDGQVVCQYKYQGQNKKNQHWHFCDANGDVTNSDSQND